MFFFFKKEKLSLERVWKFSKLKKICVHNFFFGCTHIFFEKKVVHAYFFFGESLERVSDSPNSFFPLFFKKHVFLKNDIRQRFLCEFEVSLESQTHKEIFAWCYFFFKGFSFLKEKNGEKNEFGESPNSLQTQKEYAFTTFFWVFLSGWTHIFFKKKVVNAYFFWVWREFGESLEVLQTHLFFLFFQKKLKNDIKQRFLCEFGVSLEILQTLSKLTPNSLQTHMVPCCSLFFFLVYYFFGKEEWVWSEFGDFPNSLQTRSKLICFHFFRFFFLFYFFLEKRNEFENLSKLTPNSYVFIFSVLFFFTFFWKRGMSLEWLISFHFFEFTFFGQEEWVWSEFGDSPNWLQIRSKLICFHVFSILLFFLGREEWVWSEFGDSPNSLQTHSKLKWFHVLLCFPFIVFSFLFGKDKRLWSEFGDSPNSFQTRSKVICFQVFLFFCSFLFIIYFTFLGKGEWVWNEFGVSLGILQTHPKPKWFLFFSVCFPIIVILNIFLGREEWVWSKFGGSSNSLQTYSKLTPNSYGFILSFLLYSQLIVFFIFWKRNEFSFSLLDLFKDKGMNLEVPQSLSNLAEGTCSYSAGTWNYILWPLFYWNISNKPCERISPGAAKLVQVISLRPHFRQIVSTGDRWTLRHGEPRSQVPGCCVSEKSTNPGNPHVTFLETRISSRTFPEEKPYRSKGLTFLVFWVIRPQTRSS